MSPAASEQQQEEEEEEDEGDLAEEEFASTYSGLSGDVVQRILQEYDQEGLLPRHPEPARDGEMGEYRLPGVQSEVKQHIIRIPLQLPACVWIPKSSRPGCSSLEYIAPYP